MREYLDGEESVDLPPDRAGGWKTTGARVPQRRALFVDRVWAVRLAERYDIAIMSTKGMSITAARTLIDTMIGDGMRVFGLRDFDVTGFTIAGTLGRDTRRYTRQPAGAIDLGLRLEDVRGPRAGTRGSVY